MLRRLLFGFFCVVICSTATSQIRLGDTQVVVVPGLSSPANRKYISDTTHIKISGDIRRSAVKKLVALLPEVKRKAQAFSISGEPAVHVFLDSGGGEVDAAMQIGQILRSQNALVWVDKNAECSSACILAFAGGVVRGATPGAKLGIHRPYFQPDEFANLPQSEARREYSTLAESVRSYLNQMGISGTLYDAMIKVPSQRIQYITHDFAESTQLIGNDPMWEEWERARDRKVLGTERQQMLDRYVECVNAGRSHKDCLPLLQGWNRNQ